MRSSKSRSRSKANRPRTLGNIINRVFDSSGPEGKVRGTPQQIIEKYQMLARDAQLSNDRVAAENFLQHAEHYTRLLAEAMREMAAEQDSRNAYQNGQNGGQGRFDPRSEMRLPAQGEGEQPDVSGMDLVYPDLAAADLADPERQPRGYPPRVARAHEGRSNDTRPNEPRQNNRPRDDRPRDERPRDDRPRDERRNDRQRPRGDGPDRAAGDRLGSDGSTQPFAAPDAATAMPALDSAAPMPFASPAEVVAQLTEQAAKPKPRAPRPRRPADAAPSEPTVAQQAATSPSSADLA